MIEQALIERIVADVMRQLVTDVTPAPAGGPKNATVRLQDNVVTEDTLEATVNGHQVVEVGERTIVTPTGRDWLRRRNVELIRGKSSVSITGGSVKTGFAIVHSSNEAVEKAVDHFVTTASWKQERAGNRKDAVRQAGIAVRGDTSPVIVISSEPEAVVCEANRDPNVRAAVITDATAVARVKESMQGNLFVISPAGRSYFELRHLLHSLV